MQHRQDKEVRELLSLRLVLSESQTPLTDKGTGVYRLYLQVCPRLTYLCIPAISVWKKVILLLSPCPSIPALSDCIPPLSSVGIMWPRLQWMLIMWERAESLQEGHQAVDRMVSSFGLRGGLGQGHRKKFVITCMSEAITLLKEEWRGEGRDAAEFVAL